MNVSMVLRVVGRALVGAVIGGPLVVALVATAVGLIAGEVVDPVYVGSVAVGGMTMMVNRPGFSGDCFS